MRTKPRLQPRALAKSKTFSFLPRDWERFRAYMQTKKIKNRSVALRAMLDEVEGKSA